MAKLTEFLPNELNSFTKKPFLLSVVENKYHEYSPINTIDNNSGIEFVSQAYSQKFKDLSNVYLQLQVQLLNKELKKYTTSDVVQPAFINNVLYSLFKSAYVYLNNVQVVGIDNNLIFREYIECLLNNSEEVSKARLECQGFFNDSTKLVDFTKNSKVVELFGRINLLPITKLLIPSVSLQIKFNMENPNMFIQEDSKIHSNFKLLGAKLFVKHVIVKDDLLLSTERFLTNHNAVYEFNNAIVISANVPASSSTLNLTNIYNGFRPSMIGFTMVSNKNFSGSRLTNPFDFKLFGLKNFAFLIDNQESPTPSYDLTNTTETSNFNRAFLSIYQSLNLMDSERGCLINRENYMKDRFMILSDLTSFDNALMDVNEAPSNISIGVTGSFSTALTETVTCLFYLLIPKCIEISANRAVTVVQ